MPPKKKAAAKGGDGDVDLLKQLKDNYTKACRALGFDPSDKVVKALTPPEEDESGIITQICLDVDVGSAQIRALCAAIMSRGSAMKGEPYGPLKSLRFWRCNVSDAGVAAVGELLRFGRDKLQLTHVEFMDCAVGPLGCLSLGESLMMGANKSLVTLRLDNNPSIGDEGIVQLCKGLRTNKTLKKLTASFCGLGPASAEVLGQVLSFPECALGHLDLLGNRIGSEGLLALATALMSNTSLKELVLCDNAIGSSADPEVNGKALSALADVMLFERSPLSRIDMQMNALAPSDALLLQPALVPSNTKIELFKLDDTLPPEMFAQLCRVGAGGKKGKGKKGKKK